MFAIGWALAFEWSSLQLPDPPLSGILSQTRAGLAAFGRWAGFVVSIGRSAMPTMPRTLGRRRVQGRAAYDAARRKAKPSRRWYSQARWRGRRADQLAREPLCRMCAAEGLVTAANTADHVEPHREDPERFWFGELQSLCGPCHSSVKQREEQADRGGG